MLKKLALVTTAIGILAGCAEPLANFMVDNDLDKYVLDEEDLARYGQEESTANKQDITLSWGLDEENLQKLGMNTKPAQPESPYNLQDIKDFNANNDRMPPLIMYASNAEFLKTLGSGNYIDARCVALENIRYNSTSNRLKKAKIARNINFHAPLWKRVTLREQINLLQESYIPLIRSNDPTVNEDIEICEALRAQQGQIR